MMGVNSILGQYLFFEIDARCDFDQLQPFWRPAKDGSLCNVEYLSGASVTGDGGEADLVNAIDKLLGTSFADNPQTSLPDFGFQATVVKVPQKHKAFGILSDIHKATDADKAIPQQRDVDIAKPIDLSSP